MFDVTRGITNKDQRDVVRQAMKAGCEVVITRRNHVKITTPEGKDVFSGLTSSTRQAGQMLRAELKRKGVDL